MFEGKTLKEAVAEIRNDTLFWRREVCERVLKASLTKFKGTR